MCEKRLKDPIYGYISIEESLFSQIIDTAEFQRLRRISQTSYSPLFSSAVHNRFVHSLGVYYLGTLVTRTLNKDDSVDEKRKRYHKIFELACLLHDVGHAPFSHTGESFFLNPSGDRERLHKKISELTEDNELLDDIANKSYKAAPHEIVSVIVALEKYGCLFENSVEKSFFARCILGYPYVNLDENGCVERGYLNCLISLLNSKIIDVDKLDYLIRDAYITGFNTVKIDYERFLSCVRINKVDGEFKLLYRKGAISVIENIIYAHDCEVKWMQTHPIVLYESYLLQQAMSELSVKYPHLFSYESLTTEGFKEDGFSIRLLDDGDIIFLMKNNSSQFVEEYFDRNLRLHPIWKSESEYKALFSKGYGNEIFQQVEEQVIGVCKSLNTYLFNEETRKKCYEDYNTIKEESPKTENFKILCERKENNCKLLDDIYEVLIDNDKSERFVILEAKQFNSGFLKEEMDNIELDFGDNKSCKFKEVTNILKADRSDRTAYFYIFCSKNRRKLIDKGNLAIILGKHALDEKTAVEKYELEEAFRK